MEQTNSVVMSMLQTMANTTELPKASPKADGESSDFQKLMEKAQSGQPDSQVEQQAKPEDKAEKPAAADKAEKGAPAQKEENPLERVKKLAEQGYAVFQPTAAVVTEDGQVYQPEECVVAWNGSQWETIPVTGLDEGQMRQLQNVLDNTGGFNTHTDVGDPEADAILEATAPGADNSPAAVLEKAVDEEAGQVVKQAVEEIQPQADAADDDTQVEVTDVEQAPQRLFHDVEAAPVKVGEVYEAEQTGEPEVVRQIDAQLIQAMQKGDSMVRIQLTPENLGTVTVEISQNADGVLHIALSAHSSETRGLLERHAADLQGLVGTRTQQEVQVDVQRQQESQQSQNQQRGYDGSSGHAQDGQREHRRQRGRASSQDFMQQLRLGLIPTDGEI